MSLLEDTLLADAVANNVRWCESVCGGGRTADGVWTAAGTPPPLYPDAVTLVRGVPAASLAARLADRASCSVKDSFADVDLTPYGFGLLFDARWIAREPTAAHADWSVVDEVGLPAWCAAAGLPVLPGRVLRDPSVRVLAQDAGTGAILNRSDTVVGLTNVFGSAVWGDVGSAVGRYFPGLPAVGYEHGADLDAARAAGFVELGPLRVWLRQG